MLKCMLHNLILGLIYYTACIMCSVNYIYVYDTLHTKLYMF